METVLLQDLSIGYKTKGNEKVVASHLNAAINSGELTCLLGQNGIGKSTLLRTLSAFQPPLSGSILMTMGDRCWIIGDSHHPTPNTQHPTSNTLRNATLLPSGRRTPTPNTLSRLIGVVLTEKPDVRNMTVLELVGMGRSPYTGFWGTLTDVDRQKVDEAISLVHIEALATRLIHTLSDGERQKVMIAKALAQQTPVIYLDEPTAFLDFPSKVEMMQLLRRLAIDEHKTIFLSTHDVELSLQMADRLWLMEPQGLSVGTPRELADNGVLSRFIERPGIIFERETMTIKIRN